MYAYTYMTWTRRKAEPREATGESREEGRRDRLRSCVLFSCWKMLFCNLVLCTMNMWQQQQQTTLNYKGKVMGGRESSAVETTWVRFPSPTWWLTTVIPFLGGIWSPLLTCGHCTDVAHIHTCRQNSHTLTSKSWEKWRWLWTGAECVWNAAAWGPLLINAGSTALALVIGSSILSYSYFLSTEFD